jgi:hypothetical protein
MKEKIYTIPVNEAYEKDCECPLCELEKQLEDEAVDYALGAAMMEPDYRVESNAKGYCRKHFSMMLERNNKLSLALVLDTHLEEIRKILAKHDKEAASLAKAKGSLFKKSGAAPVAQKLANELKSIRCGCMVCDKTDTTMERYADVLLYMWANDEAFKAKFERSKGVCLKHMELLLSMCPKSLKDSQQGPFIAELCAKQKEELERIQADIHKFTLKFDYRNKDMEWGTAKDAPFRTIDKISGK